MKSVTLPEPFLEKMDPAARIASLEKQVADLAARLRSVEGLVMKTKALKVAMMEIIERWPGPFTLQQVRDTLYELHPDLKPIEEHHTLESKLGRLEKQGVIICTFRGQGPQPNIYRRAQHPPSDAGRRGAKMGSKRDYESGFRSVVRSALEDLTGRFTLIDLKSWVAKHAPDLRVPEGSWSSTLYKLVQLGELKVVRYAHRGKTLKEYERTEKRVSPSGEELRDLEKAWLDFRASLGIQASPDLEMSRTERNHD